MTRRQVRHTTLLLGVAGLVGLLGCTSETTAENDPTTLCDGTVRPGVVVIRDFSFTPASLQVTAGTEVTWVNCGPTTHTSTSNTAVWNSGSMATNAVFRRTFTGAGSFPFHCEPHPAMTGTIVVQ